MKLPFGFIIYQDVQCVRLVNYMSHHHLLMFIGFISLIFQKFTFNAIAEIITLTHYDESKEESTVN